MCFMALEHQDEENSNFDDDEEFIRFLKHSKFIYNSTLFYSMFWINIYPVGFLSPCFSNV